MRILVSLILSLHLLTPMVAQAQTATRNPLTISLAEYGLILGASIMGGIVGWIRKVKSGELKPWSLAQLIGEMVISAFSGLLTFWACTAGEVPLAVTAALAGMSGLAGSNGLALAERALQKFAERKLGLTEEKTP